MLSCSEYGFILTDLNQFTHKSYEEKFGILCVAFSSVDQLFITADGQNYIKLRATDQNDVLQTYKEHKGRITSLEFAKDGSFFISGSKDKTIKVWKKIEKFRFILAHDLILHLKIIFSVTIAADSQYLLSCSEDKSIKLWNVEDGELLNSFGGDLPAINCVAFSPNGLTFLSGSQDNSIILWDFETEKKLQMFLGHTAPVNSVTFSPTGGCILSASEDKSIRL